jgi:hypothetical protein
LCLIGYEGDPTRSCSLKEIGKFCWFFKVNMALLSFIFLLSYT